MCHWGWAFTTILSISTFLKNTLSKVPFSNLLTNNFLDHPKASEDFFDFYTFGLYTFKNYTFESVVVSAHALYVGNHTDASELFKFYICRYLHIYSKSNFLTEYCDLHFYGTCFMHVHIDV